jgi:CheY-like chemotaxis protein
MQLIDNNEFDIAYIDLELPDTNGLNILCYIKNNFPDIVASIITGKSELNSVIESIKAGVFRYLKKPFDLDDIHEVTRLSIEENKKRKAAGPEILPKFRLDYLKTLLPDLLMLSPALFLGFIIQQYIFQWQQIPIIWGPREVIFMLLSFACCYSFIFFSSYGHDLRERKAGLAKIYKAYSGAYVLYAAILFFATDFIYGRLVLIFGFAIGLVGLGLSRKVVLPHIDTIFSKQNEGPRKIVLKNFNNKANIKPGPVDAEISRILKQKRIKMLDLEEAEANLTKTLNQKVKDDSGLENDWGSRLIREFRKNRQKLSDGRGKEKAEQIKSSY